MSKETAREKSFLNSIRLQAKLLDDESLQRQATQYFINWEATKDDRYRTAMFMLQMEYWKRNFIV